VICDNEFNQDELEVNQSIVLIKIIDWILSEATVKYEAEIMLFEK